MHQVRQGVRSRSWRHNMRVRRHSRCCIFYIYPKDTNNPWFHKMCYTKCVIMGTVRGRQDMHVGRLFAGGGWTYCNMIQRLRNLRNAFLYTLSPACVLRHSPKHEERTPALAAWLSPGTFLKKTWFLLNCTVLLQSVNSVVITIKYGRAIR